MNQYKIILIFIIIIIFSFPLSATASPISFISFIWTFLYDAGDAAIQSAAIEDQSLSLAAGNKIKIILHPRENTYLYLFLIDTNEDLSLLFPKRISFFDLFYKADTDYYFPGEDWAVIDDAEGTDEFILIASSGRLVRLEKLVEEYIRLLSSRKSKPEMCAEAQYNVLVEIQQLKHDNSVFTRDAKATITKIACKVRSGDDVEFPGMEITGVPFYTKTIRIEH